MSPSAPSGSHAKLGPLGRPGPLPLMAARPALSGLRHPGRGGGTRSWHRWAPSHLAPTLAKWPGRRRSPAPTRSWAASGPSHWRRRTRRLPLYRACCYPGRHSLLCTAGGGALSPRMERLTLIALMAPANALQKALSASYAKLGHPVRPRPAPIDSPSPALFVRRFPGRHSLPRRGGGTLFLFLSPALAEPSEPSEPSVK